MKSKSSSVALGLATFAGLSHGATIPNIPVVRAEPWQPALGAPWQIVLSNTLDLSGTVVPTDIEIFDIDLYDTTANGTDDSAIRTLHDLGKKVICYFSAGTYEPERPDWDKFPAEDLGNELEFWPGEYWLRLGSPAIRDIMAARISLASQMGCDAVDPDNVDGFDNENGLDLTEDDSVSFVKFLAAEAAKYDMSTGLKNAGSIIDQVLNDVHFAVNEECVNETECSMYDEFIAAKKPVFHIEYPDGAGSQIPDDVQRLYCDGNITHDIPIPDFSTVLKTMDLDGWTEYCDGTIVTTAVLPEED